LPTISFDFYKLFALVVRLFASSCPKTLAACFKILVELLHRKYIDVDQMLIVVESEAFMSKLHFILSCSMNDDLLFAVGEFFKFFAFTFVEEFFVYLPLLQNVFETREAKFPSRAMGALIQSVLTLEKWPMDSGFYEFLNLVATKLSEYEDLTEVSAQFHERLKRLFVVVLFQRSNY
jgi:hypothetical protein